jgi:hypothetical protein
MRAGAYSCQFDNPQSVQWSCHIERLSSKDSRWPLVCVAQFGRGAARETALAGGDLGLATCLSCAAGDQLVTHGRAAHLARFVA